jgi:hypothetical protein
MSANMSVLTITQQNEFIQLASIGVAPYDALVVVGIDPTAAETLCSDPDVIALHRQGRSAGSVKARKQLVKASERGSVSALKALNLHRSDDEVDVELYPKRPAPKVQIDVVASVDAAFAKMRALHEGQALEIKTVEIKKQKRIDP